MDEGLVMNRSTLSPSLDLILPIYKHAEVLIYFPYLHTWDVSPTLHRKKIISNRKRILKKKSDTVHRKKRGSSGSVLTSM